MRSAGNFGPDWGYLAPAPSFMHTARIVVVATAIGATAGVGVVLSLIERPAVETSRPVIAAHALVTSVEAATPPVVPLARAANTGAPNAATVTSGIEPPPAPPTAVAAPAADDRSASAAVASTPPAPPPSSPNVTASVEMPPAAEAAPADASSDIAVAAPEPPSSKKNSGNHKGAYYGKPKPFPIETVLRRLFTAHAGTSYYPR